MEAQTLDGQRVAVPLRQTRCVIIRVPSRFREPASAWVWRAHSELPGAAPPFRTRPPPQPHDRDRAADRGPATPTAHRPLNGTDTQLLPAAIRVWSATEPEACARAPGLAEGRGDLGKLSPRTP